MEYIDNYALRSHRKRSGLTQEDVAVLIGAQSPSQVSRQENGERDNNQEGRSRCNPKNLLAGLWAG